MQIKFSEIPISDKLDDIVKMSMEEIYKEQKRKKRRKIIVSCCSAAAVFTAAFLFCVNNPVMAGNLPLIGHIFERMQEDYSYSGDFSKVAIPLETGDVENHNEEPQNFEDSETTDNLSEYTQTVGDMTVTLSEVYCNEQALYISLMLTSKEPFPDTFRDLENKPIIKMITIGKYSFSKEEMPWSYMLEGDFTDEYTYAGIMRIDLNNVNYEETGKEPDSEGITAANVDEYITRVEIPSEFTLDLQIVLIAGYKENPDVYEYDKSLEEQEAMSDEEWLAYMKGLDMSDWEFPNEHQHYWYDGAWNFSLDLTVDESQTETITVNTTNDEGVGIESVVKTPFEMTISDLYPSPEAAIDYFTIALDADGNAMPYGNGGSCNTFAIKDRDISTVYIYVCDYMEYMDELKGNKLSKELLDERAVYSTEVHFDVEE